MSIIAAAMKIKSSVYNAIFENMPYAFHETGGILGGKDGIITEQYTDVGNPSERACCYAPNVSLLDSVILGWQSRGTDFMGLYHTHFGGAETLSEGDTDYIIRIMQAMPDNIVSLYFPIIIVPEMQIIPYMAERKDNSFSISRQDLLVIQEVE